jgi:hypothetical protein
MTGTWAVGAVIGEYIQSVVAPRIGFVLDT